LLFGEVKLPKNTQVKQVTEEKKINFHNNMAQSKFDTKYLILIFNLGTSKKKQIDN
jgi:hypothetical protein